MECTFTINGQEWKGYHLERLEYERNLHILHQLKRHGIAIKKGDDVLSDDEIDYLTSEEAWEVSVAVRAAYTGEEIAEYFKESFALSDQMWKELAFDQEKPMKVSRCHASVIGHSLNEHLMMLKKMQTDETLVLAIHPEHLPTIVSETGIVGVEPFGMYGTPTLVRLSYAQLSEIGSRIPQDRLEDYPRMTLGKAFLSDGITPVNIPFHQFKETDDGFEAELAVYWPEKTPDDLVFGHALHLAMEFYGDIKRI